MDVLLDPNLAYFFLVSGLMLAILALFSTGTGYIEVGAFIALAVAGYAIANPALPINIWALILLIVGVFPFVLALKKSRQYIYLAIALLALIIGSVFLFRNPQGGPAVDPLLAVILSLLAGGLLWFMIKKGIEAISQAPIHSLENLIGETGFARTDIETEGVVLIGSEEWTARSNSLIKSGKPVRIIGRQGFIVIVEPFDQDGS